MSKPVISHTPAPWHWADGWKKYKVGLGEFEGPKFLGLQLLGADGEEIIPMRVDHHEVIIDFNSAEEEPIAQGNREFIIRCVNSHQALLEACKEALWVLDSLSPVDSETKANIKNAAVKVLDAIRLAEKPHD
jgi:hypothetical protein